MSPPRTAGKRRMRAAADGNGVEVSHRAGLGTHAIHAVGAGWVVWCCLDTAVVVVVVVVVVVSSRSTTW